MNNIDEKKKAYEESINKQIAKFDINPLIVDNKKILLAKRIPNVQFGNTWHMPGGKVFTNERFIDSLKRMTKMKTNLDIDFLYENMNENVVGVYDDPKRDPREHVVGITFFCKVVGGNSEAGGNCSEVNFFSKDEIKALSTAFGHDYMLEDGIKKLEKLDLI